MTEQTEKDRHRSTAEALRLMTLNWEKQLAECSRLASRVAGLEADVTRWQLLAGKLDCKTCTPGLASRVEELEKLMQEIVEAAVDGCDYCSICQEDAEEHEASCVIGLAQLLLAGAHVEIRRSK